MHNTLEQELIWDLYQGWIKETQRKFLGYLAFVYQDSPLEQIVLSLRRPTQASLPQQVKSAQSVSFYSSMTCPRMIVEE